MPQRMSPPDLYPCCRKPQAFIEAGVIEGAEAACSIQPNVFDYLSNLEWIRADKPSDRARKSNSSQVEDGALGRIA